MRVTVNIPDPVGKRAEDLAREQGVSVSALYAEAVEAYIGMLRRERALARIRSVIGSSPPETALDELSRDRAASERDIA